MAQRLPEEAAVSTGDGSPAAALPNGAVASYANELARARAELATTAKRWNRLGLFRGLAFLVATAGIGFSFGNAGRPALLVGVVAATAFAYFVWAHRRLAALRDETGRRAFVLERAYRRATHDFASLPPGPELSLEQRGPWDDDLDLFGPQSLFQRLCAASTHGGRLRLANLLAGPADWNAARARQASVRELASERAWRWEFETAAVTLDPRGALREAPDPSDLIAWAEAPATKLPPAWRWLRFVGPVLLASTIAATQLKLLPASSFLLPLLLQGLLAARTSSTAAPLFALLSPQQELLGRFVPLFRSLENLPGHSSHVADLRAEVKGKAGASAMDAARSFATLAGWFELRNNTLGHFLANLLLLWDLHCLVGLERWRLAHGQRLRGWFHVVSETELLVSLAAFADDEPEAIFPELVETPCLDLTSVGHPLLPRDRRRSNTPPPLHGGQLLLVTGSNMSGKSTFLRSLGLAVVLAGVGAPICATTGRLGPLRLATSLRIRDSLAAGSSHFHAELTKLKAAVTLAEREASTFYLFDEILHGTNARERFLGAQWVLQRLMELGALGAVSTHDEQLAQLPEHWQAHVELVHFREEVRDGAMYFDFQLHPGPVRSGNALRLMRVVGLPVPLPDES